MPLRRRLEMYTEQIDAICVFTKSISFRLLEVAAWLIILYIVGRQHGRVYDF